jgi:hypothetical protein
MVTRQECKPADPAFERVRQSSLQRGAGLLQTRRRFSPALLQTEKEYSMRVMVLVKAGADSEQGRMPTSELLAAMGKYNEELLNAGILLGGDGLHPSSKGKRVAFDGPKRTVIDGPFAQTNELVAGYWIWRVSNMEEAVEWVKRAPNPMSGPSEIEIRPLFEAADFETPE